MFTYTTTTTDTTDTPNLALLAEAEMYAGEVCTTCESGESSPAFAPECRACYLARVSAQR